MLKVTIVYRVLQQGFSTLNFKQSWQHFWTSSWSQISWSHGGLNHGWLQASQLVFWWNISKSFHHYLILILYIYFLDITPDMPRLSCLVFVYQCMRNILKCQVVLCSQQPSDRADINLIAERQPSDLIPISAIRVWQPQKRGANWDTGRQCG